MLQQGLVLYTRAYLSHSQAEEDLPDLVELWEECGCTKVCLKVNSEEELLACQKACQEAGLITALIEDAGRCAGAPGTPFLSLSRLFACWLGTAAACARGSWSHADTSRASR